MPKVVSEYKEEAKKKIILAALETAGEKGFSRIKMGDISEKLGISRSTLYIYFKDKDTLTKEVLKYIRADMIARVSSSLQEMSLSEAFLAIFNGFIYSDEFYFGGGLVFEMIADTWHNKKAKDLIGEHYLVLGDAISEILLAQQKLGNLSEEIDVESAAKAIQALTLGIKASSLIGLEREQGLVIWNTTLRKILSL